jgi:hypothetical protein
VTTVHIENSVPHRVRVVIASPKGAPIVSFIIAAAFGATVYCGFVSTNGPLVAAVIGLSLAILGVLIETFTVVLGEEYLFDSADRTISILRRYRPRTKRKLVDGKDVAAVRIKRYSGGESSDWHRVLLVSKSGRVRLSFPIIEIGAAACRRVGRALAFEFDVPFEDRIPSEK